LADAKPSAMLSLLFVLSALCLLVASDRPERDQPSRSEESE
jgi:hypothetical protein